MVSYMEQKDKQPTGSTFGFHFAGLSLEETKSLRARLGDIAYRLGYISHRGPLSGRGNAAALLAAIADGEVVVIRRDRQDTTPRESAM